MHSRMNPGRPGGERIDADVAKVRPIRTAPSRHIKLWTNHTLNPTSGKITRRQAAVTSLQW